MKLFPQRLVGPGLADHFQSGLVDNIQQVFGIHGQRVSSRQHLLLVLLLQAGHDVLLGQLHLVNELRQVRVQQLLGHLDLEREGSVNLSALMAAIPHGNGTIRPPSPLLDIPG